MYITDDTDIEEALGSLGKTAQAPSLERIHDGIADYDTTFALINRYERDSAHKALGFRAGQWFETTEEVYWYFLECLPPLHMTSGGFVVSECTMHGLYESFMDIDGRYYCAVVEWNDRQSFSALWTALLSEVQS